MTSNKKSKQQTEFLTGRRKETVSLETIKTSARITRSKKGTQNACPFKTGSEAAIKWLEFFNSEDDSELGTDVVVEESTTE